MPPLNISSFVPCLNQDPKYAAYEIGDYTYGHPKIVDFGEGIKLKIGKFCSIADDSVFMLGGEHHLDLVSTYPFNQFFEFAYGRCQVSHPRRKVEAITIGNDVWIGQEAMVLSGVTIGNGAVVAARAVVTRDVGPYEVVAGSPARRIKYRFDDPGLGTSESLIAAMNRIAWWDWPIEQIADAIPLIMSRDLEAFVAKYRESD